MRSRVQRNFLRGLFSLYHSLPLALQRFARQVLRTSHTLPLLARTETLVTSIDGLIFELDLRNVIDVSLYYEGVWEPWTTRAIREIVRPGMTVIDVGANIGAHTLLFARLVGDGGRVFAFEPSPDAYARLLRNVTLNQFRNVTPVNGALGDQKRVTTTRIDAAYRLRREAADSRKTIKVEFDTLDNFVSSHRVRSVDVLKIDTDGYENRVISGATASLSKFHPYIVLEVDAENLVRHGDDLTSLIRRLDLLGYDFFSDRGMRRYGSVEEVARIIPHNVVCIPRSKASYLGSKTEFSRSRESHSGRSG